MDRPQADSSDETVSLPCPPRDETQGSPPTRRALLGPPPQLPERYLLEGLLGAGGMGVVYRVFDRELERQVALKVVRGAVEADPNAWARFLEEARVGARLGHPAIVPVYDLGRTGSGAWFYTMRLLEGQSLQDVLDGGGKSEPLSLFVLLQAFIRVCRAVAYAHEHQVIHRDLKPSNVMLGHWDTVYVLDWGLAKLLGRAELPAPKPDQELVEGESGRLHTQLGEVLGTPAYMAPEQAASDLFAVGPPADVYALGGILYALLTRRAPRDGAASKVLRELILGMAPTAPRKVAPDVPPDLERVCLQALDPAADQRPSAATLADLVQGYLEGRSLSAMTSGVEAEYLRGFRVATFRRPSVAVDLVPVWRSPDGPRVLLQRRLTPPFKGTWALPGTFIELQEPLEGAVRRLLESEVSREAGPVEFRQVGIYADPSRDPRTRVIAVAYLALLPSAPSSLAESLEWFALEEAPDGLRLRTRPGQDAVRPEHVPLAFDHGAMLEDAWRVLRA